MKILLVDDSDAMRKVITNCLATFNNYEILEAKDGQEGLDLFIEHKNNIKLVLTDWTMPVMDGYTLLLKIKESATDVPVVMITTESEKSSVVKAIQAGAKNYISKPFTAEQIKEKLSPFLA